MAVRTTTDQATALLERRVAPARVRGSQSPDTEATALFESIALNLLLKPRAAMLFALLAKNGLRNATQTEYTTLTNLQASINDLVNPSLSVTNTSTLKDASNALVQLEQLDSVTTSSVQYKKFDSSLTSFLNSISKSVKKPGATALTRPGTEAAQDLVSDFTALVTNHADTLQRLYAITVGVDNFLTSPLSTILGLTTVSRARADLDDLINSIEATGSAPADRDMVVRLITNRSAIKTMGSLPNLGDPLVDTTQNLPTGYTVQGESDPATASALSNVGPFTLPALAQMSVQVGTSSLGPFSFPQTTTDLNNQAFITSGPVAFPIFIPANYYLFFTIDNAMYKVGPFTSAITSLATFLTDLNALFAAGPPAVTGLTIEEFIKPGSNRLIIRHSSAATLQLSSVFADGTGSFTNSLHTLIGFTGNELGLSGTTPIQAIVDAAHYLFFPLAETTIQADQQFKVATLSTAPGTTLTIVAPAVFGIAGGHTASSDTFRLFGTVNGVQTDPVSPIGLMDIGDPATLPTGSDTIASLSDTRVKLANPLPTFNGNVHIESELAVVYNYFKTLLDPFVTSWLQGKFSKNLNALNLALSSIGQGNLQSQKNIALGLIADLLADITSLQAVLDDPNTILPSTSAQQERQVVDGIIATLTERKFDKALALFMKCQIQEALNSTADTASFGGAFIKAASDFAKTDMVVPNRALDQDVEGTSTQPTKGL